ncbi:hypothetical protein PTSG_02265 [Salpingoeca rosetta]|uniref:PA domain-containing protein n=1 Tax=Salpingoeca rosetta (strain ATCC 50818 / BSB-021) TaxID=946362 RepID=F2U1P5_SALR5|nr:uncharacterized protein PTSG_02265 [Salpingoeca rosetta]EGD81547.1 hypothetical protein PTSG_02265 [Salpingoeca rosetta]|eukprot:XP_004996751.1 hypothetical protein PTSG_02265 [Salpingoeca rosetta]
MQSLTSGTVRFPSMEADFGPSLTSQGYTGMLVVGVPRDGCGPLQPAAANVTQFVLLERGGNPICEFDEKVLRAEEAGYSAAIIYDTIDEGLIVMRGRQNVDIPSVFVTHSAGVILSQHA